METPQEIVELSRRYGTGHDWVIANGGNTSIKAERTLWVKASGTMLSTIVADQFVAMDIDALDRIWDAEYPVEKQQREQRALEDLMAARLDRESTLRPSVETLMHALFPQRLVVHTHPTLVNGLTCAVDGERAARELFGDEALWIPSIDPGYTLSRDMHRRMSEWRAARDGRWPALVLLQNHGLVVAAETADEVDAVHRRIAGLIESRIRRHPEPDSDVQGTQELLELAAVVTLAMRGTSGAAGVGTPEPSATAFSSPEIIRMSASPERLESSLGACTPDHIVYMGHRICYVSPDQTPASGDALGEATRTAIEEFRGAEGQDPVIIVFKNRGAVAVSPSGTRAEIARLLLLNAVKIAVYAESFGGMRFLPPEQVDFIRGWEVEKFRSSAAG